ncbi:MAG: flavohemoglobin expression-modulating QEGLA motif protein [Candidatus Krumholzibacteria bacterium]|nr:flavohemoglobin expression-modulating QEGLA motif protein [Candidatus Krumholzibacteria bacterium]
MIASRELPEAEVEKLSEAATILWRAERPLRVLRTVAWGPQVADRFFKAGANALPEVEYAPVDATASLEGVAAARALIQGSTPVHAWLSRLSDSVETTARLLAAVGTRAFHEHSLTLFGAPRRRFFDGRNSPLDLAQRLHEVLSEFDHCDLILDDTPTMLSVEALKAHIDEGVTRLFGDSAPHIEIVDDLSAKAVAGANRIRLRRNAAFSDLDAAQLLHHEAYVHICTSINGKAQQRFPILGAGHPGTTRTQEGLAVLAELTQGALDPTRMHRLADRVFAIQMAIDGADFLDLYRYFLNRAPNEFEAFENARRVVRGGLVTGGAPFTKDGVYLEGLLRVHNYLRVVVKAGDVRLIRALFTGKLDLEDIPAILMLDDAKRLEKPRFLPPWIRDLRPLVTYLSYSRFLDRIDLGTVEARIEALFRGESSHGTGPGAEGNPS